MTSASAETIVSLSLAEPSVRRNVVSTLLGNLVFTGTQWLITVAIARLGSMAMVGQYALGLAICTPIFAFTGLQMRAVQATDCTDRYRFSNYLTVRSAGTVCALIAIVVLSLLMPWQRDTVLVVLAVAGAKAVESFSDVVYGLFQLRDRLDLVARATAIRGVAGLIALTITMVICRSAGMAVAAMSVVWVASLILYERPIALRIERLPRATLTPRVADPGNCRKLVTLCLPLAFVLLLLSGATSFPRVLLERYSGDQALGVFSAVATTSGAIGLLYSAFGQTALPRLARVFESNPAEFRVVMGRMMAGAAALGGAMLVGAWCLGVQLIALLYGHQGTVTRELVTGLVAVGVLGNTSSLLGAGLTASRRFWSQFKAALMVLVVTAAVSVWLIPAWGARGAMYAGLVGATFQLVAYGFLCWHKR